MVERTAPTEVGPSRSAAAVINLHSGGHIGSGYTAASGAVTTRVQIFVLLFIVVGPWESHLAPLPQFLDL